jgi:hypothetical protein
MAKGRLQMKRRFKAGWTALALTGLAAIEAPASALAAQLPALQHQGPVAYVTGGIGRPEAQLFERQMSRYPLAIELVEHARRRAAFTADANVTIADARGRTVLQTRAAGPFMLVDLPDGHYSIVASLGHARLTKSAVQVRRGRPARATFEFPRNTD